MQFERNERLLETIQNRELGQMTSNEVVERVRTLCDANRDLMELPHFNFMSKFDEVLKTSIWLNHGDADAPASGGLKALMRCLESTITLCRKQDLHRS